MRKPIDLEGTCVISGTAVEFVLPIASHRSGVKSKSWSTIRRIDFLPDCVNPRADDVTKGRKLIILLMIISDKTDPYYQTDNLILSADN